MSTSFCSVGLTANLRGVIRLEKLINQAKQLYADIKAKEKEIDNPALTIGILTELSFFVENIGVDE